MNAQYQLMAPPAPPTKEMQETINHLVLGITMWISVTVTCVTTMLTVHQAWCLLALLIPFIYTMFPQIQKATSNARDAAYSKYKTRRDDKIKEKQESKFNDALDANGKELIEIEINENADGRAV